MEEASNQFRFWRFPKEAQREWCSKNCSLQANRYACAERNHQPGWTGNFLHG